MDLRKFIKSEEVKRELRLEELKSIPPPLWKHQKEAIERAKNLDYFGLFFPVGVGKTRTLLHILEDKFEQNGRVLKTLIFSPLIVVRNLEREFKQYGNLSKDRIVVLDGHMSLRLNKFNRIKSTGHVVITNYEALYAKQLLSAFRLWAPEVFVADELHRLKDPKATRTKQALQLASLAKYRFGLSGTPILNSQLDLFTQIQLLDDGKTFGKNFYLYRAKYFMDVNAARKGSASYFPNFVPRPGINEELKKAIAPFTAHVKKEEALDLPPLIKTTQIVELSQAQQKAYNEMKKDFVTYVLEKACVAELALTKALRLLQITSGFISTEDESCIGFDENPRLEALDRLLQEITTHSKVIVWCVFKKNYEMIGKLCDSSKIGYTTLYGDTKDKQGSIDSFCNDETKRVMIAHPGAGGIGINLIEASYMIYYSRNFSLEQDIQSEARNYRGGSEIHKKITRIDLVAKDTIDEIVIKALEEKKKIGEDVLSSKFGNKELLKMIKDGI